MTRYTHELYAATLRHLRSHADNLAETWHRRKAADWFMATSRFSTKLNLRLVTSAQYWAVPKG